MRIGLWEKRPLDVGPMRLQWGDDLDETEAGRWVIDERSEVVTMRKALAHERCFGFHWRVGTDRKHCE